LIYWLAWPTNDIFRAIGAISEKIMLASYLDPMARRLKTAEAAAISGVESRDINRFFDEKIVSSKLLSSDSGRGLSPIACVFIAFYFGTAKLLTADLRRSVIARLEALATGRTHSKDFHDWLSNDWTIREDLLTLDVRPYFERTINVLDLLEQARRKVVTDKDILGGAPVIAGTRIPVYDVAASVTAGHSEDAILKAYPSLKRPDIAMAVLYAKANPVRGRPVLVKFFRTGR
jgi:uncharacterized protein (DUF433 family)